MSDHVNFFALLNLQKARRQTVGLSMDIERLIRRGDALRRRRFRLLAQASQGSEFFGTEKIPVVGPALGLGGSTDADEAAAALKHLEAIAVVDGGNHGRFCVDVLADLELTRPGVDFSIPRRELRRLLVTAAGHQHCEHG